ncbi:MAG: hypothetical protein ACYC62_06995 [Coriobacteriia bacterium]
MCGSRPVAAHASADPGRVIIMSIAITNTGRAMVLRLTSQMR